MKLSERQALYNWVMDNYFIVWMDAPTASCVNPTFDEYLQAEHPAIWVEWRMSR